jgi:hypothetical protein
LKNCDKSSYQSLVLIRCLHLHVKTQLPYTLVTSYKTTQRHISGSIDDHCENLAVGSVEFIFKEPQRGGSELNADVKVAAQVEICG